MKLIKFIHCADGVLDEIYADFLNLILKLVWILQQLSLNLV